MDLVDVETHRRAASRAELALAPGERLLAGGTWMFSEPQHGVTGLVDLTTLGWPAWREHTETLEVAATCSVAELADLAALPERVLGSAGPATRTCADALLMSFKVQRSATVGGNIALGLPAGAITAWAAGLGAEALVWTPEGGERRQPVGELVVGPGRTTLAPGEVLRSVLVPRSALRGPVAARRTSLTRLGRSAALVLGRRTPPGEAPARTVLTVTAATERPVTLDLSASPTAAEVSDRLDAVDCWYADPHGAPDWREAMTRRLCAQVLEDLDATADEEPT